MNLLIKLDKWHKMNVICTRFVTFSGIWQIWRSFSSRWVFKWDDFSNLQFLHLRQLDWSGSKFNNISVVTLPGRRRWPLVGLLMSEWQSFGWNGSKGQQQPGHYFVTKYSDLFNRWGILELQFYCTLYIVSSIHDLNLGTFSRPS